MVDDASSDKHYFVVNGRRWRKTDPSIPTQLETRLVKELMKARRLVKDSLARDDHVDEAIARSRVNDAKVALGERGRAWWLDQSQEDLKKRITSTIRALLNSVDSESTICPSEVARVVGGASWRDCMNAVRSVAESLRQKGALQITQGGMVVDPPVRGPVRFKRLKVDL